MDICFPLLWVYTKEWVAGSSDRSTFSFVRNHTAFQSGVPFCLPIDGDCEFLLLRLLTSGGAGISALDFAHPNSCVRVSHGCFNLHFPDDIRCGSSFHVPSAICTSS